MGQNVPKMSGVVNRMTPRTHGGMSTGERIRLLMGRARVNRPQLAEWCHVSVKSMARYEKDEIMPISPSGPATSPRTTTACGPPLPKGLLGRLARHRT